MWPRQHRPAGSLLPRTTTKPDVYGFTTPEARKTSSTTSNHCSAGMDPHKHIQAPCLLCRAHLGPKDKPLVCKSRCLPSQIATPSARLDHP